MSNWQRELDAAIRAAQVAGAEAMKYFGPPLPAASKQDGSPVTAADRQCERLIVRELSARLPGYGFLGEEMGRSGSAAGPCWIIDPIDGTREFAAGIPAWAVLIALEVDARRVVGLMYSPPTDEWTWASENGPALYNGRPVELSPAARLGEATIIHGRTDRMIERGYGRVAELLEERAGRCLTTDLVNGPMELVAGRAAAMIDTGKIWDHAASECIITQAGGRFSDFLGHARIDQGSGICSNGLIHQELLALCHEAMNL